MRRFYLFTQALIFEGIVFTNGKVAINQEEDHRYHEYGTLCESWESWEELRKEYGNCPYIFLDGDPMLPTDDDWSDWTSSLTPWPTRKQLDEPMGESSA